MPFVRGYPFKDGLFEVSLFKDGLFEVSLFEDGLFEVSLFEVSLFKDGLFEDGLRMVNLSIICSRKVCSRMSQSATGMAPLL